MFMNEKQMCVQRQVGVAVVLQQSPTLHSSLNMEPLPRNPTFLDVDPNLSSSYNIHIVGGGTELIDNIFSLKNNV